MSMPRTQENGNLLVRSYLDFDGTMTGMTGGDTIKTEFYKSFRFNQGDSNKMNLIMDALEGTLKAKLEVSKESLDYCLDRIKKGEDVVIVSLNQKNYIQFMLERAMTRDGMQPVEIKKIISAIRIIDRNELVTICANKSEVEPKMEAVRIIESGQAKDGRKPAGLVMVVDDDVKHRKAMKRGAEEASSGNPRVLSSSSEENELVQPGEWAKKTIAIDHHKSALLQIQNLSQPQVGAQPQTKATETPSAQEGNILINFPLGLTPIDSKNRQAAIKQLIGSGQTIINNWLKEQTPEVLERVRNTASNMIAANNKNVHAVKKLSELVQAIPRKADPEEEIAKDLIARFARGEFVNPSELVGKFDLSKLEKIKSLIDAKVVVDAKEMELTPEESAGLCLRIAISETKKKDVSSVEEASRVSAQAQSVSVSQKAGQAKGEKMHMLQDLSSMGRSTDLGKKLKEPDGSEPSRRRGGPGG